MDPITRFRRHGNQWKGLLIIFFFTICLSEIQAQSRSIVVNLDAGIAKLPMKEWVDFFGSSPNYEASEFATIIGGELVYNFTTKHSISIHVSQIEYESNLHLTNVWTDEMGSIIDSSFGKIHWDFESVPIRIGYKFYPTAKLRSYVSFRTGYYLSRVKPKAEPIFTGSGYLSISNDERKGRGYGFEIGLGLERRIAEHAMLTAELSYRYADGMGFTDKPNDIKVEFTGLYLISKIGWQF